MLNPDDWTLNQIRLLSIHDLLLIDKDKWYDIIVLQLAEYAIWFQSEADLESVPPLQGYSSFFVDAKPSIIVCRAVMNLITLMVHDRWRLMA